MAVFDQSSKKTKTNYKNEDGSFITTIPVTRSDAVVVTDGNTTIYLDETLTDIKSKLTPDAEPNQFAFSTLTLNGDATKKIEANAKTSNLNLVAGSNITLTPGTGDKCEVTITAKDTTYETVTTTESGLMSAASYVKLNGIEENANKYVHYTGTQAGTYKSVTVNAEGHVTTGTNPTTLSGYGINDAYIDADKSQIKLGTNTFGFGDILRTSSSLDASKLTGTLSLNAPTATKATNDSDGNKITTTYATKTELNSILATNDAMIFKGTIGTGGTITALPASHNAGWTYKVITANTYAGVKCEVGDLIICITDGTTSNNNHWTVVQTNIDGAVTGPTSVTGDRIAVFNGTSGKIIKDGGTTISSLTSSIEAALPKAGGTMTGALTLAAAPTADLHAATKKYVDDSIPTSSTTSPKMDGTATVGTEMAFARGDHIHPTDTSRAAASHSHGNVTNSGTITSSSVTPANGDYIIITDSSDSSKISKGISISIDTTKFLRNDGTWAVPPDTKYTHPSHTARNIGLYKVEVDSEGHVSNVASVEKSDITALGIPSADTTYPTFTSSASGLVPAGGSGTTKFLRQDGTWVVPPDTDTVYIHPTITADGTTGTATPVHGGTFNVIESVTVNNEGHVTGYKTTTVTLPEGVDSNYVTNAISNIAHPVTSINNKNGAVELTASDVGAAGANDTAIIRTWSSLTGGAN